MEQEYIKGDIVMYDNKIHTIMDTLGVNNYELSYVDTIQITHFLMFQ